MSSFVLSAAMCGPSWLVEGKSSGNAEDGFLFRSPHPPVRQRRRDRNGAVGSALKLYSITLTT